MVYLLSHFFIDSTGFWNTSIKVNIITCTGVRTLLHNTPTTLCVYTYTCTCTCMYIVHAHHYIIMYYIPCTCTCMCVVILYLVWVVGDGEYSKVTKEGRLYRLVPHPGDQPWVRPPTSTPRHTHDPHTKRLGGWGGRGRRGRLRLIGRRWHRWILGLVNVLLHTFQFTTPRPCQCVCVCV